MRSLTVAPRTTRPSAARRANAAAKPRSRGPMRVLAVQKAPQKPGQDSDKIMEELKSIGMTPSSAKDVLSKWKEAGVTDAESLRKILIRRTQQPLQGLGIQTVMDLVAASGGWYVASLGAQDMAADPWFGLVAQLAGNFFGIYYSIQVIFELMVIGSILYSSYKYSTSSAELLVAVQQLAGPGTGVSVVDQAQRAINTIKVVQALDALNAALKDTYPTEGSNRNPEGARLSTLRNLSAMMTLKHAKEVYGFKPEQYGLTEQQASNIALAFATYDLNDNGRLDKYELGKLCAELGKPLDDEELKAAMKVLDTDGSRMIEFNEFVAWWQGRTSLEGLTASGGASK